MTSRSNIKKALNKIFRGIEGLKSIHPGRKFTIDGRLVGDIGEMLAELHYQIELDEVSKPMHDGTDSYGRRVQVKATFKDSLTFKKSPDVYLGLKLFEDGRFEEIYNGPPDNIVNTYNHRKGFGEELLSFPIKKLRELSSNISNEDRVIRRTNV